MERNEVAGKNYLAQQQLWKSFIANKISFITIQMVVFSLVAVSFCSKDICVYFVSVYRQMISKPIGTYIDGNVIGMIWLCFHLFHYMCGCVLFCSLIN